MPEQKDKKKGELYWKRWDGEKLEDVDGEQETYLNKCFKESLLMHDADDPYFVGCEICIVHEMLLPIEKEKGTK